MTFPYIKKTEDGYLLSLRVEPRSSKSEIIGIHGERLKIKIKSPPVDGKANKEVIAFLADKLNVKKADISIVSGKSSRYKVVKIITECIELVDLS